MNKQNSTLIMAIVLVLVGVVAVGYSFKSQLFSKRPSQVEEALPAREEAPVGASAPIQIADGNAAVEKTSACDKPGVKPRERVPIEPEAVKELYLKKREIKVVVAANSDCVRVTQKVFLIQFANQKRSRDVWRGVGKIKTLRANGEATVEVENAVLGTWSYLPSTCEGFCTRVVMEPPANLDGKQNLLLDLRDPRDAIRWTPPVKALKYFPEGSIEDDLVKSLGVPIKGKSFTVFEYGPYPFKPDILTVMKVLLDNGAAEVNWLYPGAHGLDGRPSLESLAKGLDNVDAVDAMGLIAKGAVPVAPVKPPDPTVVDFLPGTVLAPAIRYFDAHAWTRPSMDTISRMSVSSAFDVSKVPKDGRALIVYGDSQMDWRPILLAKLLVSRGYGRVYIFRGGLDEYADAKSYEVLP